jgi:hypothetical protein
MPTPSCCDRLTLRVVLLKVSPLVARLISVPDDFLWKSFTTFCSSFSAGADKRSTTSASTAKRSADDAICEPTSCASSSFGVARSSYTLGFPSNCYSDPKVTVERPLRLHSQFTPKTIESLRFASGDEDLRAKKAIKFFGETQGWSPEEVRQQVLTPLEQSSLLGTPN